MNKIIESITSNLIFQLIMSLIIYCFYAIVISICLIPGISIVLFSFQKFLAPVASDLSLRIINIAFFSLSIGAAIYSYFITGVLFMGIVIRLISLGIKEGKYPAVSFTCFRWLMYSGIYMIAVKTILPLIQLSFFSTIFYKILGCKMGKNVYINTIMLNDPQFLEIGDNVIVGGVTDLSCHIFENNFLILGKIKIGNNVQIGTRCYIMPNVTIGNNCKIGIKSYIRKNTTIPDNTYISSLSGLPMREIIKLEQANRPFRIKNRSKK